MRGGMRHVVATYDTCRYPTPQGLYDALGDDVLAAADQAAGSVVMLTGGSWRALSRTLRARGVTVSNTRDLKCDAATVANRLMWMRVRSGGRVTERLADAYRRLSGGDMHELDGRAWKMRTKALRRMKHRLHFEDALAYAIHGHYSHLLHLNRDADADALVPAMLHLGAVVGGLQAVLRRQRALGAKTDVH